MPTDTIDIIPTTAQRAAIETFSRILSSSAREKAFILTGCAGSGKSTVASIMAAEAGAAGYAVRYLAPTAQAAMVLRQKTGHQSGTIHSEIYDARERTDGPGVRFVCRRNVAACKTVYLVDEASMISDAIPRSSLMFEASGALLSDLIEYALGNQDHRIVIIGDPNQLPPIGVRESPGLSPEYLLDKFGVHALAAHLERSQRMVAGAMVESVVEASLGAINAGHRAARVAAPTIGPIQSALNHFCSEPKGGTTAVICWTNRDVNTFNKAVRRERGWSGVLEAGDEVILDRSTIIDDTFAQRGSRLEVVDVLQLEDHCGLSFQTVGLRMLTPVESDGSFYHLVCLESLLTPRGGSLRDEQELLLYHEALRTNPVYRDTRRLSDDLYLSALRLRYGYAQTCHRAQGGEWDTVLLNRNYRLDDLRWQYTAVTRARKEVRLFGP